MNRNSERDVSDHILKIVRVCLIQRLNWICNSIMCSFLLCWASIVCRNIEVGNGLEDKFIVRLLCWIPASPQILKSYTWTTHIFICLALYLKGQRTLLCSNNGQCRLFVSMIVCIRCELLNVRACVFLFLCLCACARFTWHLCLNSFCSSEYSFFSFFFFFLFYCQYFFLSRLLLGIYFPTNIYFTKIEHVKYIVPMVTYRCVTVGLE